MDTMAKVPRPYYLEWLRSWKDRDVIKVVTGIRRSGKTTLLELFREELVAGGVRQECIVSINFEDPDIEPFSDYRSAWRYVRERFPAEGRAYVFLDEVQLVPDFERVVDGLFAKKDCDVYITGSNAKFLSGELATFLTGRYVEVQVGPFSFAEYMSAFPGRQPDRAFSDYLRFGGFPFAASLPCGSRSMGDYLSGILDTILYKDILARKRLRDGALLKRLAHFVHDNIGNPLSVNRIVGTFKAEGISVPHATLDVLLDALCETFLVFKANRYDVKGRGYLKTNAKYYVADSGLRWVLLGDRRNDFGHLLENVVYLELRRRYRNVFVGVLGQQEVDFVALTNGTPHYFQVALSVRDENTLKRELAPLKAIRDQYPKTLLTLDADPPFDYDGIRQVNVVDYLLCGAETVWDAPSA